MSLDERSLDSFFTYSEMTYDTLKQSDADEVLFHFTGDLSTGYANAISTKLEKVVEAMVDDKRAQKRFYTAYIEAIQNIRLHAVKLANGEIPGGVTVAIRNQQICAYFRNIILKENQTKLLERYEAVNMLDRKELKKRYMDQMMNGSMSKKGGAGLGIITIVLRSQNPSKVEVFPIDDTYAGFSSMVCVDFSTG